MGGWSAALAPPFIEFAGVEHGARVLDLGCGTGNLLAGLLERCGPADLTGIDPSRPLLERARGRPELAGVTLLDGGAASLPLNDASFDHVLSMLVLQEFADPPAALAEMRRVTRAGGGVSACQWDFARMPVIAAVVAALIEVEPDIGHGLTTRSMHRFRDEDDMVEAWEAAGLHAVATDRIRVTRRFVHFDEIFAALLGGTTPSTLALAALPAAKLATARALIRTRLVSEGDGDLEVTAEAMVVRGRN